MTERFNAKPVTNNTAETHRGRRAWLTVGLAGALVTAACTAQSSAVANKPLVSSHVAVPVKLADEKNTVLGLRLRAVTAHTTLDIAFTNCTSNGNVYAPKFGIILADFAQGQKTLITSPKDDGVSCETVSTSMPDKLEVDVPLTSFTTLIPGMKRPTIEFTKANGTFDTYMDELPTVSVSSGLAHARSLKDVLDTSFKDYIIFKEGHQAVQLDFNRITPDR